MPFSLVRVEGLAPQPFGLLSRRVCVLHLPQAAHADCSSPPIIQTNKKSIRWMPFSLASADLLDADRETNFSNK